MQPYLSPSHTESEEMQSKINCILGKSISKYGWRQKMCTADDHTGALNKCIFSIPCPALCHPQSHSIPFHLQSHPQSHSILSPTPFHPIPSPVPFHPHSIPILSPISSPVPFHPHSLSILPPIPSPVPFHPHSHSIPPHPHSHSIPPHPQSHPILSPIPSPIPSLHPPHLHSHLIPCPIPSPVHFIPRSSSPLQAQQLTSVSDEMSPPSKISRIDPAMINFAWSSFAS